MISLNIFSKCPYNGNPKTRLKDLLNKEERSFITLHMLINILDEVSNISNDFKVTLWIYPHLKDNLFHDIKKKYKINIEQQQGSSLCERMNNCLFLESSKYEKTILIGSDIPSLTKDIITDAEYSLLKKDIVIGPSTDGGFYLIGVKRPYENLIDCTKPMNIENLKYNINSRSLDLELLKELKDIDTPKDLLFI
ncbi:MAG: glycosyltransferase A (GT-A) superfamily protein (DUF2064 family) [Gammaproteobacteria bacterium]|jgi:glycosyltransferase A (GT-A) superfamily protein (DUF2064 family)|tara:strand:+ start:6965 stop:7546 length:582 start_codon:yes stop_codon:yes gene_type:complete